MDVPRPEVRIANVSGLHAGAAWYFTVASASNGVVGLPSPPSAYPCVPATAAPGVVADLNITNGNGGCVVSWSSPRVGGGSVVSYTVTVSGGGAEPNTTVVPARVAAARQSATVNGLVNGRTYNVSVRACTCAGLSAAVTGSAQPTVTAPGPVLVVAVSYPDGAQAAASLALNVSWQAPPDTGGVTPQQLLYQVSVTDTTTESDQGQSESESGVGEPQRTQSRHEVAVTVSSLVPCCWLVVNGTNSQPLMRGHVYVAAVTAVNDVGSGPSSDASPGCSPGATLPSPPTSVVVKSPSPNAATVSWSSVIGLGPSGGSPVFQYNVVVVLQVASIALLERKQRK